MHTFATVLIRAAVLTLAIAVIGVAGRQDTPNRGNGRQVLVQALVTDRNGHPVSGLSAGDFHILEDGVPQQISSLTTGVAAGPQPAGAQHSATSSESSRALSRDAGRIALAPELIIRTAISDSVLTKLGSSDKGHLPLV